LTIKPDLLDRVPPNDQDSERAVLGSFLIDPRRIDEVSAILKPADFYADANRRLYAHMVAMHDARERIDVFLLERRLSNAGDLEAIGGVPYLGELSVSVAAASNALFYARIVLRMSQLRTLIQSGLDIVRDAYDPAGDPATILAAAEKSLGAIATGEYQGEPVAAQESVRTALEEIDQLHQRGTGCGLLTGFEDFDRTIGGLFPGELAILAARPAQGKTSLAMQIGHHAATAGHTVYVASLEMRQTELAKKLLCSVGGVNSRKLRGATLDQGDISRLVGAGYQVSALPLWLHDRPGMSVYDIRRAARHIARKGLELVIVDYLQMVTPDNERVSREQQVAKIGRGLKQLAGELKVPVLCLCQLNRAAEDNEEPQLRNLRESGSLEQDADMVMFIGRGVKWSEDSAPVASHSYLYLKKNRNGELGRFRLEWEAGVTWFKTPRTCNAANF